jgi:protein-S-isoprenylcysteine O-methyltransferase Ste14
MYLLYTWGWACCLVYSTIPSFWLMIHTRADYWRRRGTSPYRILIPIWVAMWVLAGFVTAPWRKTALYQTRWPLIPAVVLFALGIELYLRSRVGFSAKQLGGLPELRPNHPETRLVTTGIRSRVRHPVYVAHLCEMLAWSIGTGLTLCFALTAFAILTGAVMIRKEDTELEARFGDAYRIYREQVPAILPRPL